MFRSYLLVGLMSYLTVSTALPPPSDVLDISQDMTALIANWTAEARAQGTDFSSSPMEEKYILGQSEDPTFIGNISASASSEINRRQTYNPNIFLYTHGGCFDWTNLNGRPPATSSERQTYFTSFLNARNYILANYPIGPYINWIGPQSVFTWSFGTMNLVIRNQDRCLTSHWEWGNVIKMMDHIWPACSGQAQGWGYVYTRPEVVAIIYWNGRGGIPNPTIKCSGTGAKRNEPLTI
ncbi:hypothetical protein VTL71DRAFT_5924 [Oculimacula yallundae]|uniref:Uncharacterized protein n=1 Tax=Oculimacula yallundae TaxID=86028 RepID=A0ABR4BZV9_9HELO